MKARMGVKTEIPAATEPVEVKPTQAKTILSDPNSLMNRSKSLAEKKANFGVEGDMRTKLGKSGNMGRERKSLSKGIVGGYQPTNMQEQLDKEISDERRKAELMGRLKLADAKRPKYVQVEHVEEKTQDVNEIFSKIHSKLDSAQKKFDPSFGQRAMATVFDENANRSEANSTKFEKTPATLDSSAAATTVRDAASTPAQFRSASTDEQGNRNSILPGSGRPSKIPRLSTGPEPKAFNKSPKKTPKRKAVT